MLHAEMVSGVKSAIKNQSGIFHLDGRYQIGIIAFMKLIDFIAATDTNETAFAQKLGVSQVTINRYVKNQRFPDPAMIERIEKLTNRKVTVTDWYRQAAEARSAEIASTPPEQRAAS